MEPLGTILGVWAHPDDETYLTGGLMARGVRESSRVVCITATRGEGGSMDRKRWPPEEMGKVREAELMASLAVLGVTEHHWLDYIDGTCASVPHEEAAAKILAVIEEIHPDSVFTFGPDGMTGHDDHKAVNAWTTDAFLRGARPGARLYHASMPPDWAERFVPEFNRFDLFAPGTPVTVPRDELAIAFELPADLLELKMKAILAHESQVEHMFRTFSEDFVRDSQSGEFFRLAATR